ncbi:MAG: SUMF1/EgtB/PvdO family nonheme iron enzyme [Treponema sp.]|jgi:formylglycine-generating enzyme required for sulfatase activity|nr:SUMF1/EgtB/PvdO family nonheme iron enzyme [Treponema sp.]
MFGKNRRIEHQNSPEDQVRLKTLAGLRPGVYLAVLYSLAVLIILYFILLHPGVSRPGSVVALKTEPAGAALRVDGLYQGASPARIFVPQGRHRFELVLPGYAPLEFEEEIRGRVFGSLFFPLIHRVEKELTADADAAGALALGAADYAAWSFAGEPTAAWQIPLSLSTGAYRSGPAAKTRHGEMNNILRAAARFGSTKAALRDLIRAKALIDNGGLSPSPGSLFRSAGDLIGFLSETPGAAAWLADTLPPEAAALVSGSAWYQKQLAAGDEAPAAERTAPGPGGRLRLGPLGFTSVPGGILAQSQVFPRTSAVESFWISETEVSAGAFDAFLIARPQWESRNAESLREQGLAGGGYLSGDGGFRRGDGSGITQVSWHAARAFCDWLSGQLPPSMADWEVRLPTEAEWEYAAKSARGWAASGIRGLGGGLWEWCEEPYAPLNFIEAPAEARAATGSPERSLRGGAGITSGSAARLETRASLPPESCSPLVSFRPVIARKTAAPGA